MGIDYILSIGSTGTTNVIRQIAVNFDGPHPVIYATTSEAAANRLVAITDTGAGSAFTLVATAGANTVFRGVTFSPVPGPTLRVLFIGDSLLGISTDYANNIPLHLARLAANLGDSFSYLTIANNGWDLLDHSTNAPSTNAINSSEYDLVVLQDQSDAPSIPSERNSEMFPACRALNMLITNQSEHTMFYETWGHINGDTASHCASYDIPPQYKTCDGGFGSFSAMNIATREGYAMIAGQLGAAISPAGLAWARVRTERTNLDLYILNDGYDDRHPNSYGAYLAACVFYGAIFGRSPEGSTYYSTNDISEAQYLQHVADETIFDNPFATDTYGFGSNNFRWAFTWQNFTNPASAPPGTVVISGAWAAPSPSVLVAADVGSAGNLWLGTLDTNYSKVGQGTALPGGGRLARRDGRDDRGQGRQGLRAAQRREPRRERCADTGRRGGWLRRIRARTERCARAILNGSGTGAFQFSGGTLNFGQFGSPSHPLDLDAEAGTLALTNTPGGSVIYGNFTLGNPATLALELGSTNMPLTVSGVAALGGTLRVTWATGFVPVAGQQFTLLSAASITGNFTNIILPTVGENGLGLIATVTATSVVAGVSNFAAHLDSVSVSNGTLRLRVAGISGSSYTLQTSTNLVNWSPLQTNAAPFIYTMGATTNGQRRFYRAILVH